MCYLVAVFGAQAVESPCNSGPAAWALSTTSQIPNAFSLELENSKFYCWVVSAGFILSAMYMATASMSRYLRPTSPQLGMSPE